ncbi:MAG: 2-hydroxyacid dehydrogenase [Roseibacillus sp.]
MKVAVFDTKPYDREFLGKRGVGIDWDFRESRLRSETAALAEGCEAVCVFVNDRVDGDCLAALAEKQVRHVALRCAGFNNVDLEAAVRLGITVSRVPAYSPHAVAEHTVALLMTLNRRIHRAYNRVREHDFSLVGLVGFDLFKKTVGIIGAGKIGRITAEIFRGFGCKVVVYDPYLDEGWAQKNLVEGVSLNKLLAVSDVVSLHLPLTEETFHLIDEAALARMKKGSYLLNTGRGKLVDSKALIAALKSKHLGGVALDVYEEEEGIFFEDLSDTILEDDRLGRLLTFPNVLLTSHQGFLTTEALSEIAEVTCDNFERLGRGESLIEGTEVTPS